MSLVIEKRNNILEIRFNRPEVHNAFNDEVIEQVINIFEDIDETIRLVIISAEGKSFCAGADLNWMKSMKEYSMEQNIADSQQLHKMFSAIDNCSCPVLGKVHGHALGGGVGVVAVCDFVLASSKAKFGFTEVRLGLIPAVISPYCIKKIGISNARAHFLSGAVFTAQTAKEMGLVHEVVESEELDSRFTEIVTSYLHAGPQAARDSKELIKSVSDIPEEQVSDYTTEFIARKRISEEGQEGMSALLEKRKANWVLDDK